MTYLIVMLDGNNISLRVAIIATTTTNWLQEQHMLAARSSSFISCRPKATTNGEEEISARYIASRDGDDDLSCHVAPMAATTTFRVTQWRRQQNHGCDNNIAACTIVTTYNIASHSGDNDNASRDGDDLSYCVARWRRRQRVNGISCYIASRHGGDDDDDALQRQQHDGCCQRRGHMLHLKHRRYNQLLKMST